MNVPLLQNPSVPSLDGVMSTTYFNDEPYLIDLNNNLKGDASHSNLTGCIAFST
jgi:hypothetical protein